MKRILSIGCVVLVISVLLGCATGVEEKEQDVRVPVTVQTVTRGDLEQSLTYQGDIKARVEVRVFSKIPDRIARFFVKEGDVVKKGEPLAEIYATSIRQGVRQARAALSAAEAQHSNMKEEFQRSERLFKEGAVSQQQYDQVKTQYKAAKAQLEQAEAGLQSAKEGLKDATVTSPIQGVVGRRYMEAGDMASPGMPLILMVQMDSVEIRFDVTENDLGKIKTGQTARVHIKSYKDKVFTGKVKRISPVLDPMTRMATVKVHIDNPEGLLRSGMYAKVEIVTGIVENTILVPRFATLENTRLNRESSGNQVVKEYHVFVVKDSLAEQRTLDINYINHVRMAVDSGLQVGEKLIVEGQNNIKDQTPVKIVKEESEL
ncbi:MAG: efflux RND transporter periplasmic adaptor subunit [candidate division KSB1 bacterium]|nr:efflux RND transporter periplasmic adaptor subunit [candidate division KSB1 bacterium]